MSQLDLDKIKEDLLARRRVLSGDVEQLSNELRSAAEAGGNNHMPSEIADMGQSSADQDMSFSRLASEGDEIGQIDEALKRIADGEDGNCEECSEAIPPARLEALPHARLCIKCQSNLESRS